MKVKQGDIVKIIPEKYIKGAEKMKISSWTAPSRKRLSRFERFRLAEFTWRQSLDHLTQEYLGDEIVTGVVIQFNRFGEFRYIAEYGNGAHAKLPTSVGRLYPNLVEENFHWL